MIKTEKRKKFFYFIFIPLIFILMVICMRFSNTPTPQDRIGIIVPFIIIGVCIIFFPFILLPISRKDTKKFIRLVEILRPKKEERQKLELSYIENNGKKDSVSLKIKLQISFWKSFSPEVYIFICYNGEIVLNNTVYIGSTLELKSLNTIERAWFKWFLKYYLDAFYEKGVNKKANQIIGGEYD